MCPRDSQTLFLYESCGHSIPEGACLYYSLKLNQCTEDIVNPKKFDPRYMRFGGRVEGKCSFCKMGKDPRGSFAFGQKWEDAAKYRKWRS